MSVNKKKKYRIQIILVIITLFTNSMMGPLMQGEGFTHWIPLDQMGGQVSIIFTMYVLGAIIGVLMGYILTPLFLIIHKKIIGRKMIYGIQERPEPQKFKDTFKAFFPALLALNFALMFVFNPTVMELARVKADPVDLGFVWVIVTLFLTLIVTFGIAMTLFSPIWFLLDAGIVYTNKEKVRDRINPIEMKSVGGWYMGFLKGYAGISVIFAFYSFVVELLNQISSEQFHWGQPLLLFLLPLLLCLWSLPAILIFEFTREKRRKFVYKWANKIGITKDLNIEITQK